MEYKIKPALLIIDLQNCFVSKKGSFGKLGYKISKYQKIVPMASKAYDKAKSLGIPVIFTVAVRKKSGADMFSKTHQILPKKRSEKCPISHFLIHFYFPFTNSTHCLTKRKKYAILSMLN